MYALHVREYILAMNTFILTDHKTGEMFAKQIKAKDICVTIF